MSLDDLLASDGTFTLLSVTGDRTETCAPTSGTFSGSTTIVCTLNESLDVGDEWNLTIEVTADEAQTLNNVADVELALPGVDPDNTNNHAEVEHDITDVADLSVTKTLTGTPVAGQQITYDVVVANSGPSTAHNVLLIDRLPAGVSVVTITAPGADCSVTDPSTGDTTITCGIGDLIDTGSATLSYTVLIDADVPDGTILTNGAHVYSDVFDDDNANNYAESMADVGATSTIAVAKSADPTTVTAGENVVYRIDVTNEGPSTARNVVMADAFDSLSDSEQVTLIGWSIEGGTGLCFQEDFGTTAVVCNLGDLPPNTGSIPQRTVYLTFAVDPDASPGGDDFDNTVSFSADSAITVTGDLEEEVDVEYDQDIQISKAASPSTATTGGVVKYTLEVTNGGPSAAWDVLVTDFLPTDLEFLYASDAACGVVFNTLVCDVGTMMPGDSYAVDYFMQVPTDYPCFDPIVANGASVEWDSDDSGIFAGRDSIEFSNEVETPVTCVSDLWIRKFGKPDGAGARRRGPDLLRERDEPRPRARRSRARS